MCYVVSWSDPQLFLQPHAVLCGGYTRNANKSLARPTSRCILFDGENNPFDASLLYIQGVSRLYGITAGGDFLGLCDEKSSYKHVSDFGRLRSYGHFLIPVHAFV